MTFRIQPVRTPPNIKGAAAYPFKLQADIPRESGLQFFADRFLGRILKSMGSTLKLCHAGLELLGQGAAVADALRPGTGRGPAFMVPMRAQSGRCDSL